LKASEEPDIVNSEYLVRDFFARNSAIPLPTGPGALGVLYLDDRLIDSLGIITMVSEFESALGVRFSAEDMQSYEFQSVGGLIAILDRLTSKPR
jgi:Phosphopantetheine attachment site